MPGRRDPDRRLLRFARQMRKEPTDAERRLWSILRGKQLDGFRFRRQVPVRGYIVDFLCLSAGLAVEADGDSHGDPEERAKDEARTAVLAAAGIRVLRFDNRDVLRVPNVVGDTILRELYARADPHPNPPPEYRGRESERG